MQADAFLAACDVTYAATFRTGRNIFALDVPQLTPEQAAAAVQSEGVGRPAAVREPKPRRKDSVEEMRAYAQKMRERALARAVARA